MAFDDLEDLDFSFDLGSYLGNVGCVLSFGWKKQKDLTEKKSSPPVPEVHVRHSFSYCLPEVDFLTPIELKRIFEILPYIYRCFYCELVFSSDVQGVSFQSLYNVIRGEPTLLLIRTRETILGVFLPKAEERFKGSSQDFRFFSIKNGIVTFDKSENTTVLLCAPNMLALTSGNKMFSIGKNSEYGTFKACGDSHEYRCLQLCAIVFTP